MFEMTAMFPVLVAENLPTLKEFYETYFSFQAQFFDAEFYLHLLHPGSGTQLAFMVPDHPTQPGFLHPVAGTQGMVISFEVADVKTTYEILSKAGLDIVFELKTEEFGLTHFMVKDPAGFVIDLVEYHQQP